MHKLCGSLLDLPFASLVFVSCCVSKKCSVFSLGGSFSVGVHSQRQFWFDALEGYRHLLWRDTRCANHPKPSYCPSFQFSVSNNSKLISIIGVPLLIEFLDFFCWTLARLYPLLDLSSKCEQGRHFQPQSHNQSCFPQIEELGKKLEGCGLLKYCSRFEVVFPPRILIGKD